MQRQASAPRFIYLIQGDCSQPLPPFPAGREYLFLQWQKSFQPQPHSFHFPDSTWATGRNELLRRARLQGEYDYFVFLDDDIALGGGTWFELYRYLRRVLRNAILLGMRGYLQCFQWGFSVIYHAIRSFRKSWAFEDFEGQVAKTKPLIAFPNYYYAMRWYRAMSCRDTDAVDAGDQCFICIHTSIIDSVLPYETAHDSENWWQIALDFNEKSIEIWRKRKIHRYNRLYVRNLCARPYPRPKKRGWTIPINQVGIPNDQ